MEYITKAEVNRIAELKQKSVPAPTRRQVRLCFTLIHCCVHESALLRRRLSNRPQHAYQDLEQKNRAQQN
jgi:hypothetical protein